MRVIAILTLLVLLLPLSITVVANDDDIVLVPSAPMAGKNLIFYLPSVNVLCNGYVICENNNVHLVEIQNSLGQVTLDGGDYGEATVKIFVGNQTYTKTFDVKPFLEGVLVIETPTSVLIDVETTIKVAAGIAPAEGAVVTFRAVSGRSFNRIVDENGKIVVSFDEDGPWEIQAEFYGVTAHTSIKVMLPPMEIVFPENIKVNEEMMISFGSIADVTVTKDEVTWSYRTDANGDLFFTPPWPGKYSVYAKTNKQEGSKTFVTVSETKIKVYDYEKQVPISKIKIGQLVEIVVVDSFNVPISEIDEIIVYCDNSMGDYLPLSDGSVIWKVNKEAMVYRFEFEAIEGYKASEITVYKIIEEGFPFEDIAFYTGLIIIIFAVIFVFIRLFKSGRIPIPKMFAGKKLSDITHRGKKLE